MMMPTSAFIGTLYRGPVALSWLGAKQVPQGAEQFPGGRDALAGSPLALCGADQARPVCAVQTRPPALELLHSRRSAADQPLAPGLQPLEAFRLAGRLLTLRSQRRADRLELDLPHQLADVLSLTCPATSARDPACHADGLGQLFGQPDAGELSIAQADELLSKLLRGLRRALAGASAGLLVNWWVVVVDRH